MTINQNFPSLNAIAQSWSDIGVTLQLQSGPQLTTFDIVDIKHESIVEVGKMRGASGGRVMKRTTGQLDDTASMTLYAEAADRFEAALADVAPSRGDESAISLVFFDIIIQHTPIGATYIRKIEVLGCRHVGRSEAYAEGTDPDKCEIKLDVAKIVKVVDGKRIVLL